MQVALETGSQRRATSSALAESGAIEPGIDYEDFFENGAVGLHLVDANGVILRANKAELQMLGYSADEYIGRRIEDFHADAEVIGDILGRLSAGQPLDKYPARLRAKDGSIRHVLISSSVLFQDGAFVNTRCFSVDVTASKLAEAARLEAERRLAATYESVPVGIGETDAAGRYQRVNSAFCAITGYSREELLGMSFDQLNHPEDRESDRALYDEQVLGRRPSYAIEKRFVRKDGGVVYVDLMSSSVIEPDGTFGYGVRVVKDVTAEHLARRQLRETEQRARDLLDALPTAVYTTDPAGRITYYNEAAAEIAGRRPEIGVDLWCVTYKLFWPDGTPLPHHQCPMALALKSGEELRGVEAVALRPDGSRRVFMPYPTVLRGEDGRVMGAVNVLVDITERKLADEAQKVLVDELNHRVKNTLATVQSIALLTERSTPEAFAERFQERLLALSKTHNLLTERKWTGVDLHELLADEFTPYNESDDPRVVVDGPNLHLCSRIALALGMVVHELVTNAAKYGALSNGAGRVHLTWRVVEIAGGEGLAFNWVESGGPVVRRSARRGFGTRLIERNIIEDLAGRANLRFDPAGLRCALTFRLD